MCIILHGNNSNFCVLQEDYINKLQAKLKSYKARILEKQEEEMSDEDNKRVLFKDDVERQAVKRLKAELEVSLKYNSSDVSAFVFHKT